MNGKELQHQIMNAPWKKLIVCVKENNMFLIGDHFEIGRFDCDPLKDEILKNFMLMEDMTEEHLNNTIFRSKNYSQEIRDQKLRKILNEIS